MTSFVRTSLAAAALVATGLAGVSAVVVFRAMAAKSHQIHVERVERVAIEDAAIDRLRGAIRLPTISRGEGFGPDNVALEAFRRYLKDSFPLVHARLPFEQIGGQSLLFKWSGTDGSAKSILLMAHMDVVPVEPGTESAWSHGPFAGDLADGFIWGRGTLDDKVGVLAILEAVEGLLKDGFEPRQTILLAFGHDEEVGGVDGAARIAQVLKERGVRVEFALDEGSVITSGIIPGLATRAALIGIAEKGSASVELVAGSPGGHSSMPPPQTAAGIVAAAVSALEIHPVPAAIDGPLAKLFDRLAPEMPFLARVPLTNRWLFGKLIVGQLEKSPATNAALRTTTAATMLESGVKDNVLPARARAVVNFRIKPGDTVEGVLKHVKTTVNDDRVTIRLLFPESARGPSRQSATDSTGFKTIERTIRQIAPDAVVAPSLVIAATDMRHYEAIADDLYRFLPVVLDPDDMRRIHGTDERISVENYRDCIRFYRQLLRNSVVRQPD